jgi:hypothetical protein
MSAQGRPKREWAPKRVSAENGPAVLRTQARRDVL